MNTTERLADWLRDNCNTAELVTKWNEYCTEHGYGDDYISCNDEEFFETYFGSVWDAVRAVGYGDWNAAEDYVRLNGYGNVESFDCWDSPESPINIEMLAEWMIEADDIPDELAEEFEEELEEEED